MDELTSQSEVEEHSRGNVTLAEASEKFGIKPEAISSLNTETVVILPSNGAIANDSKSLYFHEEAKEIVFVLRDAKIQAQLYDDGRPKKSIDLRSADIVLPPLLFVGKKVLEGGLTALGAWIVNKWLKDSATKKTKAPTIKVQYVLFENGVLSKWVSLTGPASKVVDIIRGLNAKNDGSDPPRKRIG